MGRQHVGIEAPHADAEMADEQAVFHIHFDAVWSRRATGELDGNTRLETEPSAMSGKRQICCDRVTAT